MVIKLGTGPSSSPAKTFGFNPHDMRDFPPWHFSDSSYGNMVRNGDFESWSEGNAARADAWDWDSVGTFTRSATYHRGAYSGLITKTSADGAVTRVYQEILNQVTSLTDEYVWTLSAWVKVDEANHAKLFIYDGTNYMYSNVHTGSGSWERLWLTALCEDSAAEYDVGIECAEHVGVGNTETFIDEVMLSKGFIPQYFQEHPNDRSPICQTAYDDGSWEKLRGCVRYIPYDKSGTFTGGAQTETVAFTLDYGCRRIYDATVNFYACSMNWYDFELRTDNYSTTGFDIDFYRARANITAGGTYTVTGVICAVGWDDRAEQWL